MCKDARAITLQVCSADILRQFFQTVRTLSEPSCVEDIFAFEMGNHSKEINEQPIYDTREYFVNLLRDFVNENHQPVWYISDINRDYTFCPTYPAYICLPGQIVTQKGALMEIAKFRSKARIPALCWKHSSKPVTISRCSQPNMGFTWNACLSDKQLLEAIRLTNPLSQTLYVIDARPKVNALANVIGPTQGGYEYGYDNCVIKFLNIENIHIVRDSWLALVILILASGC
eukprot:TRINITY_DN1780_c0_g1_i5.p1 TRINITY_DN1780_c0_g1~~TRINITY_DN1780_c0_g1_i5.p1  ORF type:complete len:246 (+),score=49.34 TRINITY_DN1780_c0_g1_i5:51-740(+)